MNFVVADPLNGGAKHHCKLNLAIILAKPQNNENRDYDTAVKLFTECSKSKRSTLALNNLACCYVRGYGVPTNYGKAKKLFKKAAGDGCLVANYNLGVMHNNGLGSRQNVKKAKVYFDFVERNRDHPEYECLAAVNEDPTKLVFFTTMISYVHAANKTNY